jgi:hypothetical protein
MDARFKTKTVHEIDWNKLNELIAETYGLDDFEGTLESPNDSTHSFKVDKTENKYPHSTEENRATLLKYDSDSVAEIIKNKCCEHYSLGHILDDMCDKGVIEEGNYLVDVCW